MALTKNNANTFYKNLKVNFKRIERLAANRQLLMKANCDFSAKIKLST
jgi:NurA-like 5'-3' nuclease